MTCRMARAKSSLTTPRAPSLHEEAAGGRNVNGMGSIRGSQFRHNLLHVRLHGCLRNREVRRDNLVGHTASNFSKNLDFAIREIILRVVLREFSRDSLGYVPAPEVNCADRLQQLRPNHVLENVSSSACLQCAACEDIPFIGSQHDNPSVWMFLADRRNGIDSAQARHLQVHQCDIRALAPKHLDSLTTVRRFANDYHVLFTVKDCKMSGLK
jgi:hypothetical protein